MWGNGTNTINTYAMATKIERMVSAVQGEYLQNVEDRQVAQDKIARCCDLEFLIYLEKRVKEMTSRKYYDKNHDEIVGSAIRIAKGNL